LISGQFPAEMGVENPVPVTGSAGMDQPFVTAVTPLAQEGRMDRAEEPNRVR
jgi:hypothetical protein